VIAHVQTHPQEAAADFAARVSHHFQQEAVGKFGSQEGGDRRDNEQSNVSGLHE